MNKQLEKYEFVAGPDYTIADIAIYPWIVPYQRQSQDLDKFPALKNWFDRIAQRPAVIRSYEKAKSISFK